MDFRYWFKQTIWKQNQTKDIWKDDQRDLNSDQIYDETKELLLIFKYVVGWLMVPKDIHVLGFVTCQYVTYMTKRTLQIWLS